MTGRPKAVFKILNVLDHPHGGLILRLQLQEGDAPSVRELKKGRLRAVSPDGEEKIVEVDGFAAIGGKPSDARLARTGRADLRVHADDGRTEPAIGLQWRVEGPLD